MELQNWVAVAEESTERCPAEKYVASGGLFLLHSGQLLS